LVAALTAQEVSDFLPCPQFSEIRALADTFVLLDPTASGDAGFPERLLAANPDVLLAGWKTPPLPSVLPPRLRYVCYLAGSVRKLVDRAHLESGLLVTNWGGSVSRVVAECSLMLTLVCLRRAGHWMSAMRRPGVWKDGRTETASLFGRRVGLHGFGLIARELTRLLGPFGVDIGVCAPESDPALYAAFGVRRTSSLEELFASNDVVIELAPLNPETMGIVTERLLRLIPAGGVFVNVGRGAVVVEQALISALNQALLRGAALDVFETEPLPADHPFYRMENVLLSPHCADHTTGWMELAVEQFMENFERFRNGQPLEYIVDKQAGY